ncbi:Hsp20/alpha crystallin family protein [Desulforhabdus amnigena]|uniref:Molecular chaperone Hsp20 n=1 Tax=Desulforhabdus amnigena TaxID=40218 RepID=A0A9W6FQW7_9BACT|nr:Hsp20/alpha crystallin family protein [Desulforhabdus amnigena]NLJ27279.1 Hsp20/alpha crystallin family protein [Deltaproteobacteria bacterium]GLI32927.1 molecular chaperone Hsp20 [Desulforhabdus amnigena]
MAIVRYYNPFEFSNPFQEMARLKREVDRLFSGFMGEGPQMVTSGVFPPVNVMEDENNIYVYAELPGIQPVDIDISVVGKTLNLRGERKADEVENVNYHRRERRFGKFHKALTLSHDVNVEGVVADFKDGILKIIFPKAETAKPKKIEVKTS